MLMSSFVLVALPGGRPQLEAAVKYLTLNFIASAFFLVGLGVLYGIAGTLNMADLSVKLADQGGSDLVLSTAVLFLIAFGIKARRVSVLLLAAIVLSCHPYARGRGVRGIADQSGRLCLREGLHSGVCRPSGIPRHAAAAHRRADHGHRRVRRGEPVLHPSYPVVSTSSARSVT